MTPGVALSRLALLATLLCSLSALGCASAAIGGGGDFGDFSEPPPAGPQLAAGLQITGVTINQGVNIDLFRDGQAVQDYNAPLLTGRSGIVRVFVAPQDDWQGGAVRGEMTLYSADGDSVYEDEEQPEGPSEADSFETTFDFEFPAQALAADSAISVRLWEVQDDEAVSAAAQVSRDGAAWPASGAEPLLAEQAGGIVRIMLLPIRYDADGSGRLPDTSAEQLASIEDKVRQLYPVREVEVVVAAPHPSDIEISADGSGFSDLLSSLRDVREGRDVPFETYVHALVVPAATMTAYCGGACTTGLAYRVSSPFSADFKVGLGLGFAGDAASRILVHELGHQHDRGHAPCGGAGNTDPDFPYENGAIGVAGWDILAGERLDPEEHADFMGYCEDRWVSDYTWRALHERILSVEGLRSSREEPQRESYLSFAVAGDGAVTFERRHELRFEPGGEQWPVELLDADGLRLDTVAASFVRFSDLPGGTLVVPAPGKDVVAVRLPGGESIGSVQPSSDLVRPARP